MTGHKCDSQRDCESESGWQSLEPHIERYKSVIALWSRDRKRQTHRNCSMYKVYILQTNFKRLILPEQK